MRISKKAAAIAAASVAVLAAAPQALADGHKILRAGVEGSQPAGPELSGVKPGGLPWVVDGKSRITLRADGRLRIRVVGLVIPNADGTPGTNPVPALSAGVFCAGVRVATTDTFPLSVPAGDAMLRTKVMLPKHCMDPAVLLHPNGIQARYIGFSVPRGS